MFQNNKIKAQKCLIQNQNKKIYRKNNETDLKIELFIRIITISVYYTSKNRFLLVGNEEYSLKKRVFIIIFIKLYIIFLNIIQ